MKLVATFTLNVKHIVGITLMAVFLAVLALVQGNVLSVHVVKVQVKIVKMDLIFLSLLCLIVIVGHEALHIVTMKLLGVRVLSLKFVRALKIIPVAIMVVYDEISLDNYVLVSLVPQIISILLLMMSIIFANIVVEFTFYTGHLFPLMYGLYLIHLISSAGDFYGTMYTLVKARTLKGMWKTVLENDEVKEYKLYIEG